MTPLARQPTERPWEEIVALRRIKRLASAYLISPYERRLADKLAAAIRDYENRFAKAHT